MVQILFVVAMAAELPERMRRQLQAVRFGFSSVKESLDTDKDVAFILSGVGKSAAGAATAYGIATFAPRLVVNYGFSGALTSSGLSLGDWAVLERLYYADVDLTPLTSRPYELGELPDMPKFFESDKVLGGKALRALGELGVGVQPVYGACGDQFFSKERLGVLRQHFFAGDREKISVFDMESTACAQTALRFGIPFLSARHISDIIDMDEGERQFQKSQKQSRVQSSFDSAVEALIGALS